MNNVITTFWLLYSFYESTRVWWYCLFTFLTVGFYWWNIMEAIYFLLVSGTCYYLNTRSRAVKYAVFTTRIIQAAVPWGCLLFGPSQPSVGSRDHEGELSLREVLHAPWRWGGLEREEEMWARTCINLKQYSQQQKHIQIHACTNRHG